MDSWLAVFEDADGAQLCAGSVVAIDQVARTVTIATAEHCIDVIASVRLGRRRYPIAATGSQFARKRGTDFMLVILFLDPARDLPNITPIPIGHGDPDEVRVRRNGRMSRPAVRTATRAEARIFDEGIDEATRALCGLRLTIADPSDWRIQENDSGGPVLTGGRLAGVLSSETLAGTRTSSYCPAELPPCPPDEAECWARAGFDIVPSIFFEVRRRRHRATLVMGRPHAGA